jgi:hypothetical protein
MSSSSLDLIPEPMFLSRYRAEGQLILAGQKAILESLERFSFISIWVCLTVLGKSGVFCKSNISKKVKYSY